MKQTTPSKNFFVSVKTKNRRKVYLGLSNHPFTFKKEPYSLIVKLGKERKPFRDDSIVVIPLEIVEAVSSITPPRIEQSVTLISSTEDADEQEEDSNGSIHY